MKLVIEIGDYTKDGELRHWFMPRIEANSREGISAHDKLNQTAKLARLIDLREVVEEAVRKFYQNNTTSSPSDSSNTSGDPGTK